MHRRPVFQRLFENHPEAGIEAHHRRRQRARADPVAAGDARIAIEAGQVQREALARAAAPGRGIVRVDRAHAGVRASEQGAHFVAHRHLAAHRGAGHDQARAGDREAAVHREAEITAGLPPARLVRGLLHEMKQRGDPFIRHRRHRKNRAAGEARRRQQRADFGAHLVDARARHAVDLGERDRPARYAEEVEDREVLAGLRHRAVVGGDDEEHEIDARDAGKHVVNEALVAGDIDEAERVEVREAEVDGQAAALLLGQPIGVDAGERPDEARLAVIHVARGGDDHSLLN